MLQCMYENKQDNLQPSLFRLTIGPKTGMAFHTPCNQVPQLQGNSSPSDQLPFLRSFYKDPLNYYRETKQPIKQLFVYVIPSFLL